MEKLTLLKNRLAQYLAAEQAILRGAEYTIGSRRLRRPDLNSVRAAIADLQAQIDSLTLKYGRIKAVVFL